MVGARAVLGFGAAWAAFGTLAVFAVPSVRRMTWPGTTMSPPERAPEP